MKESLDNVLIHSLISSRFKRLCIIGIAAVATFTAAVPIAAADTIEQDASAWFFGCDVKSGDNSATVTYYQPGDEIMLADGSNTGVGPVIQTQITKDCTYTITVYLYASQTWTGGNLHSAFNNQLSFMSVTDLLPETYADFIEGIRSNSAGTLYTDLVTLSMTDLNGKDSNDFEDDYGTKFTFIFSTADGYIDNLEDGSYYLSYLIDVVEDITQSSDQIRVIMDEIEVTCTFDPNAEYYRKLALDNLTNAADDLTEKTNKLQEQEKVIMGKGNDIYDSVVEPFKGALSTATNFISMATRSTTSIGAAATVVTNQIYDPIVNSLPGEVQALFSVVPMLAFVSWLFGFGKSL